MTVHAALVGRAGPLGLGALLAGFGWLACGRVELGSYAGGNSPGGGNGAAGAGGAGVLSGPGNGEAEADLGTTGAAPTAMEGAADEPVGVFGAADDGPGASEGGASAIGDIDANVVVVLDAPDGGDLDAGDLDADAPASPDLSAEAPAESLSRRPSCRLDPRCGSDDVSCCKQRMVPAGWFQPGSGPSDASTPVWVPSLYLDEYEVTSARFAEFLRGFDAWRGAGNPTLGVGQFQGFVETGWQERWNEGLARSEEELRRGLASCSQPFLTLDALETRPDLPMNCVSWFEAFAFCAWDGGRLPTDVCPDTSVEYVRVSRGGSWYDAFSLSLMTHARRSQDPAVRYHMVGFRCASRDFL